MSLLDVMTDILAKVFSLVLAKECGNFKPKDYGYFLLVHDYAVLSFSVADTPYDARVWSIISSLFGAGLTTTS